VSRRNPGGDGELRRLEREAAHGGEEAHARLNAARMRRGMLPVPTRREAAHNDAFAVESYHFMNGTEATVMTFASGNPYKSAIVAYFNGQEVNPAHWGFQADGVTIVDYSYGPGRSGVELNDEAHAAGVANELLRRIAALQFDPQTRKNPMRNRRNPRGDEELRRLERLARQGDPGALAAWQKAVARTDSALDHAFSSLNYLVSQAKWPADDVANFLVDVATGVMASPAMLVVRDVPDSYLSRPGAAVLARAGEPAPALPAWGQYVGDRLIHIAFNDSLHVQGDPRETARLKAGTRTVVPNMYVSHGFSGAVPQRALMLWADMVVPELPPHMRGNPRGRRRNPGDARYRARERDGGAALVVERMRRGQLDPNRVLVGALLGDPVCRAALPGWHETSRGCSPPSLVEYPPTDYDHYYERSRVQNVLEAIRSFDTCDVIITPKIPNVSQGQWGTAEAIARDVIYNAAHRLGIDTQWLAAQGWYPPQEHSWLQWRAEGGGESFRQAVRDELMTRLFAWARGDEKAQVGPDSVALDIADNPGDERMRRLERAAIHDPAAQAALEAERARHGVEVLPSVRELAALVSGPHGPIAYGTAAEFPYGTPPLGMDVDSMWFVFDNMPLGVTPFASTIDKRWPGARMLFGLTGCGQNNRVVWVNLAPRCEHTIHTQEEMYHRDCSRPSVGRSSYGDPIRLCREHVEAEHAAIRRAQETAAKRRHEEEEDRRRRRNPGDADLRRLERLAAQGDLQAQAQLEAARGRVGQDQASADAAALRAGESVVFQVRNAGEGPTRGTAEGRTFNVVIEPPSRESHPDFAREVLVSFHDAEHMASGEFGPLGQSVSSYYGSSLLGGRDGTGLDLMGYEPAWKLDGPAFDVVRARLRALLRHGVGEPPEAERGRGRRRRRNPPRGDDGLRDLERRVASGDQQARFALYAEQIRRGITPSFVPDRTYPSPIGRDPRRFPPTEHYDFPNGYTFSVVFFGRGSARINARRTGDRFVLAPEYGRAVAGNARMLWRDSTTADERRTALSGEEAECRAAVAQVLTRAFLETPESMRRFA
jgi:hypothetical protein